MLKVKEYWQHEFNASQARQIATLASEAFPDSPKTTDERVALILDSEDPEQKNSRCFVIWDHETVVSFARTFNRMIFVEGQPIEVLALASVCTRESERGKGLGKMVVLKAFEQVDEGLSNVSLFQTGVPKFYEKLDCRCISNQVVNRQNQLLPDEYPFQDAHVMIYPSRFEWPDGIVDINGEAY